MPPLESPPSQDGAAIGGAGTGAKAVDTGPAAFLGLISSFRHKKQSLQGLYGLAESYVKGEPTRWDFYFKMRRVIMKLVQARSLGSGPEA